MRAQPVAGDDDLDGEIGADDGGGGGSQRSGEARGDTPLRQRVRNADDETAVLAPPINAVVRNQASKLARPTPPLTATSSSTAAQTCPLGNPHSATTNDGTGR